MTKGGKREGSGRPSGSNRYGESTHPLRVPKSRLNEVKALLATRVCNHTLPLFSSRVRAGLPTAVDHAVEDYIDLNVHLTHQVGSSFLVIASGDSMINANIHDGDMLVVDKSIEAHHGKIVIAAIDGELTVKRFIVASEKVRLVAENPNYLPIEINSENNLVILGVVTHVIHAVV